jgi:hypothetical protein
LLSPLSTIDFLRLLWALTDLGDIDPNQFGFVQILRTESTLITKDFLALAWLCAKFTIG